MIFSLLSVIGGNGFATFVNSPFSIDCHVVKIASLRRRCIGFSSIGKVENFTLDRVSWALNFWNALQGSMENLGLSKSCKARGQSFGWLVRSKFHYKIKIWKSCTTFSSLLSSFWAHFSNFRATARDSSWQTSLVSTRLWVVAVSRNSWLRRRSTIKALPTCSSSRSSLTATFAPFARR